MGTDPEGQTMRITHTTTSLFSEHLRQVEALLDPIRYDGTIDDAERRRLIGEVLASANARALEMRRWPRGLARVG